MRPFRPPRENLSSPTAGWPVIGNAGPEYEACPRAHAELLSDVRIGDDDVAPEITTDDPAGADPGYRLVGDTRSDHRARSPDPARRVSSQACPSKPSTLPYRIAAEPRIAAGVLFTVENPRTGSSVTVSTRPMADLTMAAQVRWPNSGNASSLLQQDLLHRPLQLSGVAFGRDLQAHGLSFRITRSTLTQKLKISVSSHHRLPPVSILPTTSSI